jgi:predicted small secreted protein
MKRVLLAFAVGCLLLAGCIVKKGEPTDVKAVALAQLQAIIDADLDAYLKHFHDP